MPLESKHKKQKNKGQVVVEYILLLVLGVTMALLITKTLVSRSEEEPGLLIQKWRQILTFIAEDYVDE